MVIFLWIFQFFLPFLHWPPKNFNFSYFFPLFSGGPWLRAWSYLSQQICPSFRWSRTFRGNSRSPIENLLRPRTFWHSAPRLLQPQPSTFGNLQNRVCEPTNPVLLFPFIHFVASFGFAFRKLFGIIKWEMRHTNLLNENEIIFPFTGWPSWSKRKMAGFGLQVSERRGRVC